MGSLPNHTALLQEQIAYYQARAGEYDEWFLRQGRYDHGEGQNRQWFAEVAQVRQALAAIRPTGQILELACGTGLWTEQLEPYADPITAVDASSEVLALNQTRIKSSKVTYHQADIFAWQAEQAYDLVFFSFWLSHVPPDRFNEFWALVATAVKPGGRVFFVDSRYEPTSTAHDQPLAGAAATTVRRRLNDGREFQIVKVFYQAKALANQLRPLGWQVAISETAHHFFYGLGQESEPV